MPRAKSLERQRLEALAEEKGIPYETLRKQVAREAKAEGKLPPVPELWGMAVPEEAIRELREGQAKFDGASSHLRQALGLINQVPSSVVPADRRRILVDAIREANQLVRGHRPACLCPYCKGLPGVMEHCIASVGTRWLAAKQVDAVPAEFTDKANPIVADASGRRLPVSEVAKPPGATPTEDAPAGQPEAEDTLPLDVEYDEELEQDAGAYDGPFDPRDGMDPDDIGPGPGPEALVGDPWGLD